MFPAKTQMAVPSVVSQGQGLPAPQAPQWQGPPVPDARTVMQNFQKSGTRSLDLGTPTSSSVPLGSMDTWEQQMPQNPPQQNPMDVWASQMPQNPPIVPQAPPTPSPAEWQGPTYVNPVAQHLSQLGASALQQFPLLGAFAPPITQEPYTRVDTSPGTVFDMLRQRGQGVVSGAQQAFGALAPPRPTPSVKGPMWEALRRKGAFGR